MREALKDILAEPQMVCTYFLSVSVVFDDAQSSIRLPSTATSGSHSLPLSQEKEGTHDGPDDLVVSNSTRGQCKIPIETHKNIALVPSSSSLASSEGRPKVDRESELI